MKNKLTDGINSPITITISFYKDYNYIIDVGENKVKLKLVLNWNS